MQDSPLAELREAAAGAIQDWAAARAADPLSEVYRWALLPPGKLLRPLLLLASARAVGGRCEQVLPAAVGVELAHVASLLHDDIIDGDDRRRGRAAVHQRYGAAAAILGGDCLSFALFQQLGACRRRGVPDPLIADAMEIAAAVVQGAARGVAREIALSGPAARSGEPDDADRVAAYLEMVRLKTATPLSATCRIGVTLAGGDPRCADLLAAYGEALGIAFQIHDDLLPYTPGCAADKPPASDLRNQRPALPLLLARQRGTPADRALLAALASGGGDERERQDAARRLVRDTGALDQAQHMLGQYLGRCRRATAWVPAGHGRDILTELPSILLDAPGDPHPAQPAPA
ncbi:polyprenyl synthetase family protein [Streptomyces sp. PR69]|uniref:polyprenyl synthetase family protein n=1 Tax=Streptomyces sp. PR69 TaxID=2984950 RepID=UPI0022653661|nr:polyprenyl synthetase family protein [Streptomyces sp. PR69]